MRSVLMLAVAGLLSLALWRGTAAARHLVWSIALTLLLLLPLLSLLPSPWSFPVLPTPALMQAREAAAALPTTATATQAGLTGLTMPPQRAASAAATTVWALFAIWLTGAALLALRLATGVLRMLRLMREAVPGGDSRWSAEVDDLRARLRISRSVRLFLAPRELMPLTWGVLRPVVVLPASAREWPAERRHAVLLHELAHIARWDCLTQLIAQVVCLLHWPNPLAWLASGRMLAEREQACDDQVLLCGTSPAAYATHLVDIARAFGAGTPSYSAGAAMARRSRLESRIRAILSFPAERGAARLPLLVAGALAVTLILPLSLLHSKTAGEDASGAAADEPVSEAAARGEMQVMWEASPSRYETAFRGTGDLTADETGVARLSRDGYLKIVAQRLRGSDLPPVTMRTLSILERGGQLVYEQTVEGRPRPFDAESRQWLARVLPEVTAETGFGAGTRVSHLLRGGGVDRLFAEVERIQNPRVKRAFLGEALHSGLGSSDLRKVVRFAGRDLPPDGDLAAFLASSADLYLQDPEDRAAFLEAAGAIHSEDEYARFMAALLKGPHLSPEISAELIRTAFNTLVSDETKAGFLLRMGDGSLADPALRESFLTAVKSIRDDRPRAALRDMLRSHGES